MDVEKSGMPFCGENPGQLLYFYLLWECFKNCRNLKYRHRCKALLTMHSYIMLLTCFKEAI